MIQSDLFVASICFAKKQSSVHTSEDSFFCVNIDSILSTQFSSTFASEGRVYRYDGHLLFLVQHLPHSNYRASPTVHQHTLGLHNTELN